MAIKKILATQEKIKACMYFSFCQFFYNSNKTLTKTGMFICKVKGRVGS